MSLPPSVRRACAAAILAGGRASRLGGADKAALVVGGRTILARQLDALAGLVDEIVLVGDHAAPDADAAAAGLPRVPDLAAGRGPLAGIQAALHRPSSAECTLIVACDLPFLSRPFLAHLITRAVDRRDTVDAVVPQSGDRRHPLCATYNRRVREAVDRRVASGALAVHGLLDEVRVEIVGPEVLATFDPAGVMLWNVNTPDEYERACARAAMA
jgi:molybdopterin-guanine dinucleotide biosynthesis protein A